MVKSRSKGNVDGGNQALAIGAVAGGLLGLGVTLFLTSKKGKHLCSDMYETYQNLSDKASDLKDDLMEQSEDLMEKVQNWVSPEEQHSNTNLIIGSIAGGLLGATAIYFACQQSGMSCQSFINKAQVMLPKDLKKKSECWLQKTKETLEKLTNALNQFEENVEETVHSKESKVQGIVDLANLGFRLFNSIKQRR